MKICILTPSYPQFEEDTRVPFMRAFVKEIAKTNDVTVVTSIGPKSKSFSIMDDAKIYRFQYFFPKKMQRLTYTESGGMFESYNSSFLAKIQIPFFLTAFFLKSLKHCKKCDIIHAQWLLSGFVAFFVTKICKKPIICEERGGGIKYMPRWLSRFTARRMDVINSWGPDLTAIFNSIGIKDNIVDIKGMIDFSKLKKAHPERIKKELSIKNEKVITFIGRLVEMKDPLTFVKSIPLVLKKDKNIRFIIAGDGHLRKYVEDFVKEADIQEYVHILGDRSDVNNLLSISDIFVATSAVAHCFSATIMEAMYMKIPCLLTNAPFTEQYFTHKKYAYLVPVKNPEKLAEGILYLLKDKKLRERLSKNSHSFLKEIGVDQETIIKQTNELYKKVYDGFYVKK